MKKIALFAVALCMFGQIATTRAAEPPKTGEKRDTMIYVRSTPSGAKVLLDGEEIGRTNGLFRVDAGVATIVLELQGHAQVKQKITIPANGITRVVIELKPQNAAVAETYPATPQSPREDRYFVRLVIGRDAMTFEGKETTWDEFPALLEQMPDHPQTVLEVAAASDDLSDDVREKATRRALPTSQRLGFEYISYIGVHPLGSKGSDSLKVARSRQHGPGSNDAEVANSESYWAKYERWAGYQKGAGGVQKDPEKAKTLAAQLVKGVYLAKFRPANGFAPKTPGEFLENCNSHSSLRSGRNRIGGASFFRTTVKDGVLVGSFLTEYPDEMRRDIETNPSLKLLSIEKLTPEMFVRHDASPQESLPDARNSDGQSGSELRRQQQKARERMRRDAQTYSQEQLREIESLYQVANQRWRTQQARDVLKVLVEKYKKANRTGCAILYLGQMSRGDEQIAYYKQAIADHSDCFYGDGVQVGAFARALLGQIYLGKGDADQAKKLFDEIRKDYPHAVDHRGNPLVAKLPVVEQSTNSDMTVPVGQNILTNSGIESGDKSPEAWQQGAPIDGVTYTWDKKVASEGKASLSIEKTAKRYFPIAQWSQTVDRTGDSPTLNVSAQVKTENMTKAILDVLFLDEDGKWISHKWVAYVGSKQPGDPPVTHDWKNYSGKVEIPENTAHICIGLQVYGPGKVWFDDVRATYGTAEPQIVSMSPPNGAKDVDPGVKELRVTFDMPMAGGFSWTGGGPKFPKTTGRPHWTDDHKTCILPVQLNADSDYRLGLNSPSFKNFRSKWGIPLNPVEYRFSTRAAAESDTSATP